MYLCSFWYQQLLFILLNGLLVQPGRFFKTVNISDQIIFYFRINTCYLR